jgi:hypothetical protein
MPDISNTLVVFHIPFVLESINWLKLLARLNMPAMLVTSVVSQQSSG